MRGFIATVAAVCTWASFVSTPASAQRPANTGPAGAAAGAPVSGDVERYMRALEITGRIAPTPWAMRPFAQADVRDILDAPGGQPHPWQDGLARSASRPLSFGATVFLGMNSGFPWGSDDGPMWQGRGGNALVGFTASLRWGPLSAVASPVAFVAQNTSFPLMDVRPDASPFAEALFPESVDVPQRFGNAAYSRIDGGESSISVRGLGISAGLSTSSRGWGPGESFPAILGANGGGFPHLVVGTTGRGLGVPGIGRFSANYVLGVLDQSDYSPVSGGEEYVGGRQSGTRRIGVGLTASFMPALLPSLELGATRFYHSPYRDKSRRWESWSKPFEGIFKDSFTGRVGPESDFRGDFENQLASAFVRWSFPRRGGEVSFEYLREDHSWDSRDFIQQPESNSAVIASVRAATHRSANELAILTLEYFDGDIPATAQVRTAGGLYLHGTLLQGHTQRGQLLGTPIGVGAAAGQSMTWERFRKTGSTRVNVRRWRSRTKRSLSGTYVNVEQPVPDYHDWIIDGSYGMTRYRGGGALSLDAGVAYAGRWQLAQGRTNIYVRTGLSVF